MKYLFTILLFCFGFSAAFWFSTWKDFRNPYAQLCELVAKKIILPDEKVLPWKQHCLQRSRLLKPWSSREALYQDIRNTFSILKVSHLSLYTPAEVREVWEGVTGATGIKSKFIEGKLVIYDIEEGSPAATKDIRVGDYIISLNEDYPDQDSVYRTGGLFLLQRQEQEFQLDLEPQEYQRQRKPKLKRLSKASVYLRVPSFNREVMSEVDWQVYWKEVSAGDRIILDLRGNSGGNFYAGLHFLSQFLCDSPTIGSLRKKEFSEGKVAEFPLLMDDRQHIQKLQAHGRLNMKLPANEQCLRQRLLVLVDNQTSSVAEMVALALQESKRGNILGGKSAGQLLVGLWYPQSHLGSGVEVSIPEAEYQSSGLKKIEGEGVEPDFHMSEKLSHYQQGEESYLLAIDKLFSQVSKNEN